jgi:streptogramin lyase
MARRWRPSLERLENRCLPSVTIHEFLLPTSGTDVTGISKGPDGNVWFTEPQTNIVGHLTTNGSSPVEIVVPTANATPLEITSGPDGALWFTEQTGLAIGRVATNGVITTFDLPVIQNVVTGQPTGIALGPDGNLWFTEVNTSRIGRITPAGVITEFSLPTTGASPFGITAGSDGNLWFTEKTANQVGRISTAGIITEFALPTDAHPPTPWGIAAGSDGNLWVTLQGTNKIARVTTTGSVTEFMLPAAGGPEGIHAGTDGALWFAETNLNIIGRITTAGAITETTIPTPLSFPHDVAMGADANLWFTESNTDKIGEAVLPHFAVTGPDSGGGPDLRVLNTANGQIQKEFAPYDPSFTGGVRVAMGDINQDGIPDIVTAPGSGTQPDIRVYDGLTGKLITHFLAYSKFFTSGVYVAVGDVNGDGYADVITGADSGGGPHVEVWSGKSLLAGTPTLLYSFMAYNVHFLGGVRVAAGNIDGDPDADIITAAGPGGGPHVEVFSGKTGALIRSFYAFGANFSGGVYVAAADTAGDGFSDIVAGSGLGQIAEVKVFDGQDNSVLQDFSPYGGSFTGGARVAAFDVDGDGHADLLIAPGPGIGPSIHVLDGITLASLDSFFAYDSHFLGGVFIGGA